LNHPYLLQILNENKLDELPLKILESNIAFFDFQELIDLFFSKENLIKKLIITVAKPWNDSPPVAMENLQDILNLLKEYFTVSYDGNTTHRGNTDLEIEYLFHFQKIFHKISHLLTVYPFVEDLKVFRSLFSQLAQIALPFYGEPLHGLQIMGMLETQTLDFKNIILLGVNEDFLPSGKSINSFIPFSLRRNFSLPILHETNAIYAYHFYRLMQRADNIYLLYNSESGELGGGEKSRFISQLLYEFPKYNPNLKVNEKILKIPLHEDKIEDKIEISKSPEIIDILREIGEYGFSASSLNTFRNCPLQFYFKYVAGIDESEEPEETIEASTLGSVVHEVMASVYQQMKGREIIAKDILDRISQIPELLKGALKKHYPGGDTAYGKNLLIVKVAEFYITSLLDYEADFLIKIKQEGDKLEVKDIEKSFSIDLLIEDELKNFNVRLSGRFDRIDYTSGVFRLIDYKTGRVESKDLVMNSWDELLTEMRLDKCFQLLFYAYIYYRHNTPDVNPVCPGIISLRSPGQGFMKLHLPDDELVSVETLDRFESLLKSMLQKIFDTEVPFRQTDNTDNCKYCTFKQICNRI
jgi:CRISPR/Cas system-associated exonuclease Cas4 (RecB family)